MDMDTSTTNLVRSLMELELHEKERIYTVIDLASAGNKEILRILERETDPAVVRDLIDNYVDGIRS